MAKFMLRLSKEIAPMKASALALGIGLLALASPASADVREACRQDRENLCKNVERGGGRIVRCMAEHRAQLSSSCKMALADRMLERRADRGDRKPGGERR